MDIAIKPTPALKGMITAPPSKSYSHRAFIVSSLANGISVINKALVTGDVQVTLNILKVLGIKISRISDNDFMVKGLGGNFSPYDEIIDCKNSGTSLRIFSVLTLLIKGGLNFTGTFFHKKRPILPLLEAIVNWGAKFSLNSNILSIKRTKNQCKDIDIQGDISSQFITALLMIGPIIPCKKKNHININIISPLNSYPYIAITLDVLKHFGINIQERLNKSRMGNYIIPCQQNYRAQRFDIPGDFSSISYIIAAGVLAPNDTIITISNLDFTNPQGDKKLIEILQNMGAKIEIHELNRELIVWGNLSKYPLDGQEIDVQEIPDLFPILAVIGAFANDKTVLYNAKNLRYKECDRISVMARELSRMGINLEESEDKLIIYKCFKIQGINVVHEDDHRIAMALTIANLYAQTPAQIKNIEIVEDSYPSFIKDLINLGAKIDLV